MALFDQFTGGSDPNATAQPAQATGPLDPQYIDKIKKFEGYRETPYWDYKQYTSGYGTKAQGPDEKIDQATAEQRLNSSLSDAAAHVDSVNPNLPAGARAALISLTYNAGPGWAKSGLGDLVRSGDLQGAQQRLLQYNKAGGTVNPGLQQRRTQEASWFDGSVAPAQAVASNSAPTSLQPPVQQPAQVSPAARPNGLLAMLNPQQAQQQSAQMPQAAPQAAPTSGGGSYFDQMPATAVPQLPPIFTPPRRPVDISKLRAALQASGNRGLFLGQG